MSYRVRPVLTPVNRIDPTIYHFVGHFSVRRGQYEKARADEFRKIDEPFFRSGEFGLLRVARHFVGCALRKIARYLDEGGDVNRRTENGQTLLHIATENGELDIVGLLLARGADLNAKGYHGYTALHIAVDSDSGTSRQDGLRAIELTLTKLFSILERTSRCVTTMERLQEMLLLLTGRLSVYCMKRLPGSSCSAEGRFRRIPKGSW